MEPGTSADTEAFPGQRLDGTRMTLQWHVTERCNLRCTHCYQEPSAPGAELPLRDLRGIVGQFRALLDELGRRQGRVIGAQVNVTGGEPFVRQDFLDFLEILSAERPRMRFAVLTNGSFITEELASRLSRLGAAGVQVSVEGSEATHDRIRGAGDYRRTVAAVQHLVRARIRVSISFTAHRLNFRDFGEVAGLGRRLRVAAVWSDRLIPMGRGCATETLRPVEARELFRLMQAAGEEARGEWRGRTKVAMGRALQFLEGGEPYRCRAGDGLLTLLPNGDVCPCRRMPIRVGNVLEQDLSSLYFDNPTLLSLRDRNRVSRGCERCRFEPVCRGGLRCLAYAVTGDPFVADPGCWLSAL